MIQPQEQAKPIISKKLHERSEYNFWKIFHLPYKDVLLSLKALKKRGKMLSVTTGVSKRIAKMEISLFPQNLFAKIISVPLDTGISRAFL